MSIVLVRSGTESTPSARRFAQAIAGLDAKPRNLQGVQRSKVAIEGDGRFSGAKFSEQ